MADFLSSEERSRMMSRIRSADTRPEVMLRHALWKDGFRYRVNDRRLPGKPDIVLPRYRTVIFVHGCFWHGHEGCKNYTVPKTNTGFWTAKVARNRERDQEEWRRLEAMGWSVIVVWECELKKSTFGSTLSRVKSETVGNGMSRKLMEDERRASRMMLRQERVEAERRWAEQMEEIGRLFGGSPRKLKSK